MAGLLSEHASHLAMAAGGMFPLANGKLEEPEYSITNWYFSRDEIESNSPSRKDGIDVKKETYFRKSYCTFLQDLGMQLKVPQVTIATAIVLCHRFFLRQSHSRNDKFMVATVCMFLAGKIEETPRPLRDVVSLSYVLRNKKDPSAAQRIKQKELFEEQKELVLLGEHLVLTTLEFDMNIHHPYKPLVTAIKRFKIAQNALAQVAWNFVNDGLRTSLCLQFKPHHIAAGAIFLATKFLKVKLPSDGDKVWWQEFGVTPQQLEDVSNQMLELYEQNKAGPSSHRSDPGFSAEACNGCRTDISDEGNPEVAVHRNSASQPSPVLSSKMTRNQPGVENVDTTVTASQPEVEFDLCDSSRGESHSVRHGRKQGAYAGCSEAGTAWKGGIYSSDYFAYNRVDNKSMNSFKHFSAPGQELKDAAAGHAINGMSEFPVPTAHKVKHFTSPSLEDLFFEQNEIRGDTRCEGKDVMSRDGPRHQGVEMTFKKEDTGKERAPGPVHELKYDSVNELGDRKRKMKVSGGARFATVKQEVSNGDVLVLREAENSMGISNWGNSVMQQDTIESRGGQLITRSLEIPNDQEALKKSKKSIDASQSHFNTRGLNAFQQRSLATSIEPFEETANQIEDGEFGAQVQSHVLKASGGRHVSADTLGKAHNPSRELSEQPPHSHFGAREGSYDKKHRHGNNHANSNSNHHHQEFQKAEQGMNLQRQKGQVWQERDPKKLRPNHVK